MPARSDALLGIPRVCRVRVRSQDHAAAGAAILGEALRCPLLHHKSLFSRNVSSSNLVQPQEVNWWIAHSLYRTCEITRYLGIIATTSWLGGFKQLAEPVDYGQLNTGTSVSESMTGRLVKPNLCQTSSGQI